MSLVKTLYEKDLYPEIKKQAAAALKRILKAGGPAAYKATLMARSPRGTDARFILPHEVAALVFYLCQPQAAAITGADFAIGFGYSAGK